MLIESEEDKEDQDFMKPSDSSSNESLKDLLIDHPVTLSRSETQNRLIKMQMRRAMKMAENTLNGGASAAYRNQRLS